MLTPQIESSWSRDRKFANVIESQPAIYS